MVNNSIRSNIRTEINKMPVKDAINGGAIALFGEKYPDKVRVVSMSEKSNEDVADITFKSSKLKGIHLKKETVTGMIDEIPIFSVLASFASGNSSFIAYKRSSIFKPLCKLFVFPHA